MQSGEGTINGVVATLTSDHVRAAASLVKTGKIYSLAVTLIQRFMPIRGVVIKS